MPKSTLHYHHPNFLAIPSPRMSRRILDADGERGLWSGIIEHGQHWAGNISNYSIQHHEIDIVQNWGGGTGRCPQCPVDVDSATREQQLLTVAILSLTHKHSLWVNR